MFGLSKQDKFRKAYYAFLSDVFGMRVKTLLGHYPGIRRACDEGAKKKDGFGPYDSATFAARAILTHRISQLTDEHREKIHIEYNQINWNEFYAWFLHSQIEHTSPPRDVDDLTRMIAHAQCAVFHAHKNQQVDEITFEDFHRDVAGALEGLSTSERRMERMRSALDITLDHLGMDRDKFRPPM